MYKQTADMNSKYITQKVFASTHKCSVTSLLVIQRLQRTTIL